VLCCTTCSSVSGEKGRFREEFLKELRHPDAAERYVRAVRDGSFPAEKHSF